MRSIVHPVPFAAVVLLALVALLAGAGCGAPSGDTPDAASQSAPAGSRFGDDYEVLTSELPAAPDEPPALRGDTLAATLAYRGGDATHAFALDYDAGRDTARLWIRHDAAGDADSTRLLDDVRLPVPPEALRPPTVVLLNPQGGPPFVLRWDAAGADSAS